MDDPIMKGLLNSFQALNLGTNDEPSTTTTQPNAQPAAQPTSSGTSWGPCNFRQPSEIEEYYSKGVGKILKLTRPQEWRAMVTAFEDEARSKQAKSEDAVSSSSLVSPRNLLPLSEAIRTIATFPFAPPITGPPIAVPIGGKATKPSKPHHYMPARQHRSQRSQYTFSSPH
jgi:hypothetical protein